MRGVDMIFYGTLAASIISVVMSFLMMNAARDRVHKGLSLADSGDSNSNTRLATANMFIYGIIVVPFISYILFAWFLCDRDSALFAAGKQSI